MRRSEGGKRTDQRGVDVAGEVAGAPRRDRPVVVEVPAIVVSDPAGFRENAETSADDATDDVAVMGDLPPRGGSFAAEVFENTIIILNHPLRRFFVHEFAQTCALSSPFSDSDFSSIVFASSSPSRYDSPAGVIAYTPFPSSCTRPWSFIRFSRLETPDFPMSM